MKDDKAKFAGPEQLRVNWELKFNRFDKDEIRSAFAGGDIKQEPRGAEKKAKKN